MRNFADYYLQEIDKRNKEEKG